MTRRLLVLGRAQNAVKVSYLYFRRIFFRKKKKKKDLNKEVVKMKKS